MRKITIVSSGLAALLAVTAMQLPTAALALNPQPEVPSMPKPDPEPHPDPALKYQQMIQIEQSKAKRHVVPRSGTVLY